MIGPSFHPTRWTLVMRTRGEGEAAKAALADLCADYYEPVLCFLRREGRGEDAARELTHAFFESLLRGGLGTPEPGRGRFRNYLLGALKHFLAKQGEARKAIKRGGGMALLPLCGETDTHADGLSIPGICDDSLAFDREWAVALITRSLAVLEAETSRKPELFATLKPWLNGDSNCSQAEAAKALGMSDAAVKVSIHRLRARLREIIRREIATSLSDPADIADELRHLVAVLAGGIDHPA